MTLGASRNQEDRTHRIFESTVDNSVRVKVDSLSTGVLSVRAMYEYAQRRGEGFDVTLLTGASEQPGMRHFDLAERNRNRFTLVSSYMPVTNWAINLSTAIGRDDYLNSEFGLRDNNHNVYGIGVDGTPSERLNLARRTSTRITTACSGRDRRTRASSSPTLHATGRRTPVTRSTRSWRTWTS